MSKSNDLTDAIRAYVAGHPDSTMPEIAEGIGRERHEVGRKISQMVRYGALVATTPPTRSTKGLGRYRAGREVETGRANQQPKARRAFQQPPGRGQKSQGDRESDSGNGATEAYIAAGGHVERLASQWQAPTRYPAGHIWAGGRRGVSA